MKPSTLLRLTAIIAFIQFLGHSYLHSFGIATHGQEEISVIDSMRSHQFLFQGFSRSYWDFYFGYGLFAAFNSLVEAILFWQISALIDTSSVQIRRIVWLFMAANLIYITICLNYFFVTPMVFDGLICLFLGLTLIQRHRRAGVALNTHAQTDTALN